MVNLADPVVKTEGLLEAHEVDTLSEAQDWARIVWIA